MDVVTFGESLVVFNPQVSGPLRYINIFSKSIGGAESNVAIALARLGHSVGWFSKVGNDEFGRYIKDVIRGEGVDISQIKVDEKRNTGILFKERYQNLNPNVYYYRSNSAASALNADDIEENYIKSAKVLHISGITPALSESTREAVFKAVEIAKKNNVLVSFDPNIRLKLWSLEDAKSVIMKLVKSADIFMPGIDEAEMLIGSTNVEEIADYFINEGCKFVAVKMGKEGCYLRNANESLYAKGFPVNRVADTVGAGDGFAAGLLSGLIKELSLQEIGEQANGIGAMATLVEGDMEGYPDFNQLMEFIGKRKCIDR